VHMVRWYSLKTGAGERGRSHLISLPDIPAYVVEEKISSQLGLI